MGITVHHAEMQEMAGRTGRMTAVDADGKEIVTATGTGIATETGTVTVTGTEIATETETATVTGTEIATETETATATETEIVTETGSAAEIATESRRPEMISPVTTTAVKPAIAKCKKQESYEETAVKAAVFSFFRIERQSSFRYEKKRIYNREICGTIS